MHWVRNRSVRPTMESCARIAADIVRLVYVYSEISKIFASYACYRADAGDPEAPGYRGPRPARTLSTGNAPELGLYSATLPFEDRSISWSPYIPHQCNYEASLLVTFRVS